MIHLQSLTKYKESKKYKQSYVFMLLPFFFICFNFNLWIHTWKVITDGLCGHVYETENINLSPIYMNFHVKRSVWSGRKVICPMSLTRYISQDFRIFILKNQTSNSLF